MAFRSSLEVVCGIYSCSLEKYFSLFELGPPAQHDFCLPVYVCNQTINTNIQPNLTKPPSTIYDICIYEIVLSNYYLSFEIGGYKFINMACFWKSKNNILTNIISSP